MEWLLWYNSRRPHWTLGLVSPLRYICNRLPEKSHMWWTDAHPEKVFLKTEASGIDFLGWVHFPHHRVIRTTTKKQIFKKIKDSRQKPEVIQSYSGLLSHGNSQKLKLKIRIE